MKNRFDRVVPETPASFHDSLERALRATAERERRSVRLRPAALIAAALALVLAGAALALGDRMGLWSFLKQYAGREIPAKQPPAVEVLDRSARFGDYILTVSEAYREGRTASILVEIAEDAEVSSLSEPLPWEMLQVETDDGEELDVLSDDERIIDGRIYHLLTCMLPEDAPETVNLQVSLAFWDGQSIPVSLQSREASASAGVSADHTELAGTGLSFTDFNLEITSLNRTLTLRYTFDPAQLTAPTLPSPYCTYYTGGDGVYHTDPQCAQLSSAREVTLADIADEGLTACGEEGCNPLAEVYEPLPDGVYLELLDAEGNPLPCESLESEPLLSSESRSGETVFLLDGLPEVIQLRAYDCWTKHRWADTITLHISE